MREGGWLITKACYAIAHAPVARRSEYLNVVEIVRRVGLDALPAYCVRCGVALARPPREEALLDELGFAHVACPCGAVQTIPYETPEPESAARRRRRRLPMVVVWLMVLGLLALLFPIIQREPEPDRPPDPYITT